MIINQLRVLCWIIAITALFLSFTTPSNLRPVGILCMIIAAVASWGLGYMEGLLVGKYHSSHDHS